MVNVSPVWTSVNSISNQSGATVAAGMTVDCGSGSIDNVCLCRCTGRHNQSETKINQRKAKQFQQYHPSLDKLLLATTNKDLKSYLLRMLFSHIEQALNSDKDQCEDTHTNASPPRTQGAIKLEDGYDSAVNQDTKQSANHISYTTS